MVKIEIRSVALDLVLAATSMSLHADGCDPILINDFERGVARRRVRP